MLSPSTEVTIQNVAIKLAAYLEVKIQLALLELQEKQTLATDRSMMEHEENLK